jgi:hypothetical protein
VWDATKSDSKSCRGDRIFASEFVIDRLEIVATGPDVLNGPGWSVRSRVVVLFTDLNRSDVC